MNFDILVSYADTTKFASSNHAYIKNHRKSS